MVTSWQQWLQMAFAKTAAGSRRKLRPAGLPGLECLEPKTLLTAPVVVNGNENTQEDTAFAGSVAGLGSDADGNTLTYSTAATAKHGILQFNISGGFVYTPNPNYSGSDSFTFRANDGTSNSNTGTFNITITNVDNDAPVLTNASHDVMKNLAFNGTVATSGSDPENTALTFMVVNQPAKGAVVMNANGSFTYTPAVDDTGVYVFNFQASDGVNLSNVAQYTLNVKNNDAPVVIPGFANPSEDQAFPGTLLLYAGDPNGDGLTFSTISDPTHGTLTLSSNGVFVYTPDANYSGLDEFTYQANDGLVDSAVGTVTINVVPVNDPMTLTFPSGITQIARNSAPVRIDPAATVVDIDDNVNFANAQIRALVSSGNTNGDYQKGRIALKVVPQGLVTVDGTTISYGGVKIATFTGGTLGRALVIKFRNVPEVNLLSVNAVLQQISMVASKKASSITNTAGVGIRLVDVTVSAGGQKVLATKTVSVI